MASKKKVVFVFLSFLFFLCYKIYKCLYSVFSYLLKKHTSQTSQIHKSAKGKGKTFAKEIWLEGQEGHCRSEKSANSKSWCFAFLILKYCSETVPASTSQSTMKERKGSALPQGSWSADTSMASWTYTE